MNCPICDIEMKSISVKNVNIDYCDTCQGIWCDKDELEKLAMIGRDYLSSSPIASTLKKDNQDIRSQKNSSLRCPSCGATLEKFNYSYESDIFLEACKICSGIWIDDGELGDIIDYIYSK
ncbi:MAG: zf-TFIIB domain-containing protein [Ignavibacteriales bacterium]